MHITILGESVQGLIAACLLGKGGMSVSVAAFSENEYAELIDGHKTGPVTHVPFALSHDIVDDLALEMHGLDVSLCQFDNPFRVLPFYEGLRSLYGFFKELDEGKPSYKEKAWRDAWATFELGRILADQPSDIQQLFAQSTTASLCDVMVASNMDNKTQAQMMAYCLCGSKTDPAAAGTAAAVLPAMMAYEDGGYVIQGSLHPLMKSLKDAAMGFGVNFFEGQTIQSIETKEDGAVSSVTLDGGEKISADYVVLDHDPVTVFEKYIKVETLPPAFRNRVVATQNLQESVRVGLVLSDLPEGLDVYSMVAPSVDYITQARDELKKDGGAQRPFLSVVNVTHQQAEFSKNGHYVLDVLAHYFEPTENGRKTQDDVRVTATIHALNDSYPGLEDKVVHAALKPMPSQGGQANFMGAMPLLQLFKIFFGHHAIGYDVPFYNMLVAGYGAEACAHYHVHKGGARVASLLQSLNNDGKTMS